MLAYFWQAGGDITIGSEVGFRVYVSAYGARGEGAGQGTQHVNTTVDAAGTLSLSSGGDTRLEGAQASGHRVLADIGGDLILTSRQDEDSYQRKDQSAGIDVAVGFGGGSVSGNYGHVMTQ